VILNGSMTYKKIIFNDKAIILSYLYPSN